jgi:ribonuclease-3
MRPAAALAERLGLAVRDLELLQQALIHSSYLHEHRDLAVGHNERLEFLGDSVVSLAISNALYRRHPDDDEGVLSARRASIVSTAGLARLAGRLSLGEYLSLGEGESQRGGRRRPALLASTFEAVVGALYLDLGYEAAAGFVVALAAPELTSDKPLGALKSPKSRLQEFTQRLSGERPQYHLVDAVGPDHNKVFRVEVAVSGRVIGVGEGHSRRLAETAAAARAIEALRETPGDLAEQTEGAPELLAFGSGHGAGIEGEDEDEWEAFTEAGPRLDPTPEPWIEFDLELGGESGSSASRDAGPEAGRRDSR